MSSKHFLPDSLLALVVVLFMAAQTVNGLKCKICVISRHIKPDGCEILPCTSMEDVKNAMKAQFKQAAAAKEARRAKKAGAQAGKRSHTPDASADDEPDLELDPNDARVNATQFVCTRTVGGGKGGRHPHITNECAARLNGFPPAVKAYKAKDYEFAEFEATKPGAEAVKEMKAAFEHLDSDVYICDDKVGKGVNCGEKSGTDIKF